MDPKPLPFTKKLDGISAKTLAIHHDKLYAGYVKKADEIREKLIAINEKIQRGEEVEGNQTYSEIRALKEGATFAQNGVYLHEWYFDVLGGDGDAGKAPELSAAISQSWGNVENFKKYMTVAGMAARGWALLTWNPMRGALMQYNADAHNQGGVWGCIPIIVLDVYEHAYFIDFGSDRKAYIEAFWKNFNWEAAETLYKKVSTLKL